MNKLGELHEELQHQADASAPRHSDRCRARSVAAVGSADVRGRTPNGRTHSHGEPVNTVFSDTIENYDPTNEAGFPVMFRSAYFELNLTDLSAARMFDVPVLHVRRWMSGEPPRGLPLRVLVKRELLKAAQDMKARQELYQACREAYAVSFDEAQYASWFTVESLRDFLPWADADQPEEILYQKLNALVQSGTLIEGVVENQRIAGATTRIFRVVDDQ